MQGVIEFDTARLRMRQWRAADRGPFAAINADPIVMEHFPSPLTREQSDATVDHCERFLGEHGWGPWAAEIKATGELIGFVGLNIPSNDLPVSPCVEVLWRLARTHWNHGYATEAARGALYIGFEVAQLEQIVAFTVIANHRSQSVMKRLGMTRDADTFEHPSIPAGHALRSHCNFRLTRENWRTGQIGQPPSIARFGA
jgi:RimJ/RimL family protein N-acetyltransferase